MKRRSFTNGEVIFSAGDPSRSAFLVVDGEVKIHVSGEEAAASVARGEYFGEMGVVDSLPRSATAKAQGDVVCLEIDQEEFMTMLQERPQEAIELLKLLFRRLRTANKLLSERSEHQDRPSL